jgi:hypothetical protein
MAATSQPGELRFELESEMWKRSTFTQDVKLIVIDNQHFSEMTMSESKINLSS